jgi:hypothetical protein
MADFKLRDAEIRGLAPISTTPNETVGAFA